MRQATILIMVLAAVGCVADDDDENALSESEEAESKAAPTHDPTGQNCPGGSGGGRGQPQRKHCEPSTPDTICLECCYFNYDIVDGWQCRKYKRGSNNYNNCWAKAILDLADCQVETCDRRGRPPR
jgi:hypothetical protein